MKWVWVKNRVDPRWLGVENGRMAQKLRSIYPRGLILTHAQMETLKGKP